MGSKMSSWNKGLTKESDPRVASHGKVVSKSLLRSSKNRKAARENLKKATKASASLPRTEAQLEAAHKNGSKTGYRNITAYNKSDKGRKTSSENSKKARKISASLPRTNKQKEAVRKVGLANKGCKGRTNTDTIDLHHNDLCHGALRPDDKIYLPHRLHSKLHRMLEHWKTLPERQQIMVILKPTYKMLERLYEGQKSVTNPRE